MAQLLFGKSNAILDKIKKALEEYESDQPGAKAALYRQNSASVRIRVIDPSFAGLSHAQRGQKVWPCLRKLPESVRSDISVLLLLTPDETSESFANVDFDRPLPSPLK